MKAGDVEYAPADFRAQAAAPHAEQYDVLDIALPDLGGESAHRFLFSKSRFGDIKPAETIPDGVVPIGVGQRDRVIGSLP